jgi:hypothetical protein
MPKANVIQTNWTGGELSPYLYGRVDTQKYANGAKTIENFIVVPSGGVKKRTGSKFVWYARNASDKTRLVPFVYNAEQTYILEFSDTKIRFFTSQGILTQTAQNITAITKANPAVVTYSGSDTYANGDRIVIAGVLGMTEVNNREFTVANVNTGSNTFELSGVDSSAYTTYTSGGTVAEIIEVTTTYTAAECVELSTTQSADTLFIAHPAHPLAKLVRNSATSWTLSDVDVLRGPWRTLNNDETVTIKTNDVTGSVTLVSSSSLFTSTHVGALWKLYTPTRSNGEVEFGTDEAVSATEYWSYNGNVYYIVASSGTAPSSDKLTPPIHLQGTVTLYKGGNSAGDYATAKFTHKGFGVVEVTAYTSGTEVTATVYSGYGYNELPLQLADSSLTGGLATNARYVEATKFWQEGAWSAYRGYPNEVTFFEQRLMASQGQTIFGSVSGNFADFEEGANDDQALNYTLASDQADVIRWLMPGKQLLIGTTSGEYVMSASSLSEAVTPKNIKISRETTYGSSDCKPARVGNAVLFMQRRGDPDNAGRKMREMAYSFDIDGYVSNDLTIFAPHITGAGVTELAYQADPDNIIWGVRTDGKMCAITYERPQEVTAWHRHIMGGYVDANNGVAEVEQIASIPGANGDELWMKVKRYINGQTVRYIEVLNYFDDETALADGVFVDSSISYSGSSTALLTGLWHLRGQAVKYLANGVAGTATVSATGTLAVPAGTTKAHVGFSYTSKIETLDIEAGAAAGTAQARQKRIATVTARLHRSQGGLVGTTSLTDAIEYDDATLFTGDKPVSMRSGWAGVSSVYIEHSDPLPFTLVGLIIEQNTTG